jgi:hypothetical protein
MAEPEQYEYYEPKAYEQKSENKLKEATNTNESKYAFS